MANEQAEFARNYEACFFRVPLTSGKQHRAFMLSHIDRDDIGANRYYGRLITRSLQEKACSYPVNEFFNKNEPIIGTSGFVNCPLGSRHSAVYLELHPDRQYRKALCADGGSSVAYYLRTGSVELDKWLYSKCIDTNTGERILTTETLLMRAVAHQLALDGSPAFLSFRAALDKVEEGTAHSVAISKHFALSLHSQYKVPVVWHKKMREGFVVNRQVYCSPRILPFRDFFVKRFGIDLLPLSKAPKL